MRRPRNAADGAIDAWIDRQAKRKVQRPRGSLARGLAPARLGTAAICAEPPVTMYSGRVWTIGALAGYLHRNRTEA